MANLDSNLTPNTPHATPLTAVLAVTALGSIGTGAITNGVFFLAESAYGYGDRLNLTLGAVLGGAYVTGALTVGPALRRAARRFAWLSTRTVLIFVLLLIAAAAALPAVANSQPSTSGPWSLWVSVLIFAPTTGALWPIVESYLSGGRRGKGLIRAIGAFNIVWSIAVVASMWIMTLLIEKNPHGVLLVVGLVHVLAAGVVLRFAPEPARSDPDAWPDEPHPATYRVLLAVLRVLLPLSYVLSSTLSPLLPGILERLRIEIAWKPALASVWMAARVVTFVTLERWHGWHGRWSVPIGSAVLMVAGFTATVLCANFGAWGLPTLILGLFAFGLGMAGIYVGALYYVMEVGHGGVDAGGSHEAIIGIGYTLGPVCGLMAGSLAGGDDPGARDPIVLALIGVLVLLGLVVGVPMLLARDRRQDRR
ncbi:MAG: MFS family permease [Phycisphaerales bacterium]|jgi:MFS family permease